MKQKLYYLLALTFLLLFGTGKNVVHAATDPVFSAKNTATSNVSYTKSATTEITTNITIKGGKMYAVNNQTSDKDLQASGGFCMTNNNTYFKIELNQALAVGDVISVKYTGGTRVKENVTHSLGIIVNTTETTNGNGVSGACSATSESSTSLGSTLSYTVTDDDEYVGKKILYVYRAYGATQYFDEFTVTRTIVDTRTTVTLSFDSPTANANLGENFTAPTLTVDPVSAESEVTYSSSATNVATVDAASGNVTIKAAGTTTITATVSGSETYKDASASYTLNVVDPSVAKVSRTLNETKDGYDTNSVGGITVIIDDSATKGSGSKKVYAGTTEYSVSDTYRDKDGNSNLTAYDKDVYTGMKLEIADGYAYTIDNIVAKVAVSANFTYCIVITDGENIIYKSSDKAITDFNSEDATNETVTLSDLDPTLVLSGDVYIRVHYWNTGNSGSKYFVPLEISATGSLSNKVNTYNITTVANPVDAGTLKGAGTYYAGQKVFLSATNNSGYAFEKWQRDGEDFDGNTAESLTVLASSDVAYTAVFSSATTYTIAANVANGQSSYGTITNEGSNSVNEGDEITFAATANEGYAFVNWTKGDVDYSTNASITVTASGDETYVANFKKLFTVTYDIADYKSTTTKVLNNYDVSNSINEKYADVNDKYTIPAYSHYYIYRENYAFSKWKDQDNNEYNKGDEITLSKDITLTPVWTPTTQSLSNSSSEVTVTWKFEKATILFNGWQNAPEIGYYTKPQLVNGETIAVPMIIDATGGKVDNSSRTDNLAQINGGTKLTIPAVNGMRVVLTASSNISNTTVAGNKPSSGGGTNTATYNYSGDDKTIDIVINDGSYYSTIAVTYPAATEAITTNTHGNASHVASKALDFSNVEGLKAYIATAADAEGITLAEVTAVPAGTAFVVQATEKVEKTYYIPTTTETPSIGNNVFQGNATESTATESGYTYYALSKSMGMFAKVASTVQAIPAGKAFVKIQAGGGAKETLAFFFGEATGIAEAEAAEAQQGGVRKQLINGRLVIIKGDKQYNAAGGEF